MRILILEDNPRRIRAMMVKLGHTHTVHTVDGAAEAIRALKDQDYDIIFLDHDMGGQPPEYYGTICDPHDSRTGSEVVRWLLSAGNVVAANTRIVIHSLNTAAATNMHIHLVSGGFTEVDHIPFDSLVVAMEDPLFLA